MKTSLLLILLFLLPAAVCPGTVLAKGADESATVSPRWPEDAVVKVYFVRGAFSDSEIQTLFATMKSWAENIRQRGVGLSFTYAGETGGLVDCVHCLTIARQAVASDRPNQRVSLNTLRWDRRGLLLSAWIAFERADANRVDLRIVMMRVLEHSLRFDSQRRLTKSDLGAIATR